MSKESECIEKKTIACNIKDEVIKKEDEEENKKYKKYFNLLSENLSLIFYGFLKSFVYILIQNHYFNIHFILQPISFPSNTACRLFINSRVQQILYYSNLYVMCFCWISFLFLFSGIDSDAKIYGII